MIRLKYRQGSFPREEERSSEFDAITRAQYLMRLGSGCSCFQIVDQTGKVLQNDLEISSKAFARTPRGDRSTSRFDHGR